MKFYVDCLGNQKISEAIQQAAFDAGYGWLSSGQVIIPTLKYLRFNCDYKSREALSYSDNIDKDFECFSIEQAIEWFKENPKERDAFFITESGYRQMQSELSKLKEENETLKTLQAIDRETINERQKTIDELFEQRDKQQAEIENLKGKLKDAEYRWMLAATNSKVIVEDKLKSDNESLQSQIKRLKGDKGLSGIVDSLRLKEISYLKQQLEKGNRAIEYLHLLIDSYKETIQAYKSQIGTI
jgi:hypothetical protein